MIAMRPGFESMKEQNLGLGLGQSSFLEAGCPLNNCFLFNTEHDVMTNVDYSDAILFYLGKFPNEGETIIDGRIESTSFYLSWAYPRKPNQNCVMFLLEPPGIYLSDLKDLPNFFNGTMTYRYDSDIYRP
uniref:Fucosyltransferase N-terminal domain-containing protein n=1 Tax=Timema bartmani TaxID=61472 RepID=A0A7R9EPF1_9NEOP|nr:unnamed protein product [Timema bartmani]